MAATISREIHLKHRPAGLPSARDFELVAVPIPTPRAGEVLVRNLYMSVDPYMRGRMIEQPSYVTPFQLGQPLDGGCVGQIVEANGEAFQVGDYVLGRKGWREYYVSDGADLTRIDVSDHADRQPQFYADMAAWIADGKIKWQETIVDGLENAPKAFLGLFAGENTGKMLVRLCAE
jgi:NADPH-dependent curcumin reductase CurA